jgi:GNAT superfamily N-acetyltransferase
MSPSVPRGHETTSTGPSSGRTGVSSPGPGRAIFRAASGREGGRTEIEGASAPELLERAHRAIVEGAWSLLRFVPGARRQDWAGAVALACDLPSPLANSVFVRVLSSGPEAALDRYSEFFGRRTPWRFVARDPVAGELVPASQARGFHPAPADEGWVLAPLRGMPAPPAELSIEEVTDRAGLRDFVAAAAEGFDLPRWAMRSFVPARILHRSLSEPWPHLFVGRVAGRPVATSAVSLAEGVGAIQFVATVPAVRRRGYGRAITAAALEGAARAGADAVALRATRAGERMYAQMGFRRVLAYHAGDAPVARGAGLLALLRALRVAIRP